MTRVAVTSAVRRAGQAQFSGYVRVVDLDDGRTLHAEPIPESPWRRVDPNPRGGTRGARGVSVAGERIAIANADTIFVLDSRWQPLAALTHPLAGAVHDVLADDDGVWVACANSDVVLRLDWDGRVRRRWCWRDDPALVAALGFRSIAPLDATLDYRDPRVLQGGVHNVVHVNGLAPARQGGLLVSFGRVLAPRELRRRRAKARVGRAAARLGVTKPYSARPTAVPASRVPGSSAALLRLAPSGEAELLLRIAGVKVPNHNVAEDGDVLVYGDSNGGRLVAYDLAAGRERVAVTIPGEPSFVRGLARLDAGVYLVGSQAPLAVYAVDLGAGELVATYPIDGEPTESVYAIAALPDSFALPSGSIFAAAPAAAAAGGER